MKKILFSILLTISALAHGAACQTFAAGDLNYITKLNLLANGCNAVTPAAGVFTTISASGQITSTLATGTAPFVIASTTQVLNLNASQLVGSTWASPAAIGTGTPAAGTFTTLKSTSLTTGLVLGAAASNMSTYAGSSCTNQFVRSLNASGAATCATVGTSDIASSITLTTPNIGAATATTIVGTDATDATSSTAAAVKTAGGLAVAKNAIVGVNLGVGGAPSTKFHVQAGRSTFAANNEAFSIQVNNGATANGPYLGSTGADQFQISKSNGVAHATINSSSVLDVVGGVTLNGGQNLMTAWTAYTPTPTPGTGAFTTASAAGRYKQIGKTTSFNITVTITTNGTAASTVDVPLPVTAFSATGAMCVGRENSVTGAMLLGYSTSTTNLRIVKYDQTYPGGTGYTLVMNCTYEAA